MKIVVAGRTLTLTQKDFVGLGGEATVYARGNRAYKLYTDPAKTLPPGKLAELAPLADPRIVTPEELVYDPHGAVIGYAMRKVDGAYSLCQLVPRAARDRAGLTAPMAQHLVEELASAVSHVHRARVLIVDLNELNVLIDASLRQVFLIDVDSFQTAHYKATALMDSIRDRHAAPGQHSIETDWFAFAVVSFQLLIGIHPYKGKHPTVPGLDARMLQNLSVLRQEVRVPASCTPFTVLPPRWRAWYERVLDDGRREAPPTGAATIVVPTTTVATTGSRLVWVEKGSFDGLIRAVWASNGVNVVATDAFIYCDGRRVAPAPPGPLALGFTTRTQEPIVATIADGRLRLIRLTSPTPHAPPVATDLALRAEALLEGADSIHVKSGDRLIEVVLTELGGQLMPTPRLAAQVHGQATTVGRGCLFQNLLGTTWVTVVPRRGTTVTVPLPELDGHGVVDAAYDRGVLLVVARRGATTSRHLFRFAPDHQAYDHRSERDTGSLVGARLVTLDHGVAITMTDDDALELVPAAKGQPGQRLITDPALGGDLLLARTSSRLVVARGNRLYELRLG